MICQFTAPEIVNHNGSWLNMVEIELNVLMGQCPNRRIATIQEIIKEIKAWETYCNNRNAKTDWQFTAENARIKLKKLYPTFDV
jgi:hypothetical protein